jgi:signal transduction histidine kinase
LKATPELSNQDKLIRIADSILNSVKRCSTITYRLLGFARRIDVQTESIDLRSLMEEVLSFLGKEAEFRNIQVTLKAEEELPPIQSDRGQLQQVFINILNNALAAVSDGGCVEVTITRAGPDTVSLVVEDNGVGIPKKDLSRIFDPFFTTKGSKGTGLGLSITYGIVQKLRGKIEVRSEVGKGTTFTVTLPLERGM